jgi:hypothetical protein
MCVQEVASKCVWTVDSSCLCCECIEWWKWMWIVILSGDVL